MTGEEESTGSLNPEAGIKFVFIITGKARAKENTYKWVSV